MLRFGVARFVGWLLLGGIHASAIAQPVPAGAILYNRFETVGGAPFARLALEILAAPAPGELVISWPTTQGDLSLEATEKLGPQPDWQLVTKQFSTANGKSSATITVGDGTRFVRLKAQ